MVRKLSLLFLALAAAGLAAPREALADGASRRPGAGQITGRVSPKAALRAGRLQFLVDGVARPGRIGADRFLLRGVPRGRHVLSVIDMRTGRAAHRDVRVRARATTRLGVLQLRAGGQITGIVSRIVNPETGELEPLPNVEVFAEPERGGMDRNGDGVRRLVAVTDETGAYAMRGVPTGTYRVSVTVPGLEAEAQWVWVEVGRTAVADFQMREAIEDGIGTVRGTVRNEAGEPIAGALVSVYAPDEYHPSRVGRATIERARRLGRPGEAWPEKFARGYFATLTGYDGRYTLNVPTGHLWLEAYADGYNPVGEAITVHPREELTVDLTLTEYEEPGYGAVEGSVTDAATGEPIVEALVSLYVHGDGEEWVITVYTDEHGRFELVEVPEGEWKMTVEARGYEAARAAVYVKAGTVAYVEFALTAHDKH